MSAQRTIVGGSRSKRISEMLQFQKRDGSIDGAHTTWPSASITRFTSELSAPPWLTSTVVPGVLATDVLRSRKKALRRVIKLHQRQDLLFRALHAFRVRRLLPRAVVDLALEHAKLALHDPGVIFDTQRGVVLGNRRGGLV